MAKDEPVLAKVTNVKDDPAKAGRIKVDVSKMDGKGYPEWVSPVQPSGCAMHPHPGDTVEVSLPAGDDIVEFAHEARYRGQSRDEAHGYPEPFKTNYPDARGFKTPGGHYICFDDKDKTITLKTSNGHSMVFDDKNKTLTLTTTGGHTITLDDSAGTVKISNGTSGDDVEMSALGINTITATLKNILSSPLTELSTLAVQPIIKGPLFHAAQTLAWAGVGAYLTLVGAALTALAQDAIMVAILQPATVASLIAAGTPAATTVTNLITAFIGSSATWLSTKVTTG
jgi:hypothetical protein